MVSFFKKCGYHVNSPNKKQNFVINILDGLLILIYVVLSFINLYGSTPSELVFFLNVITLGRVLLKNLIEQSKVVKVQSGTDTMAITLIHVIKITVEGTLLVSIMAIHIWEVLKSGTSNAISWVVGVVLFVTLLENLWSMCERLYDATPKPLSC